MNKTVRLVALIIALPIGLWGQVCNLPNAIEKLSVNNIEAFIPNSGDLFTDFANGRFTPKQSNISNPPSTIYTTGLWIAGVDPGGNLKLAANTYRNSSNAPGDYWSGPLDFSTNLTPSECNQWNRLFRATYREIQAFLGDPSVKGNPSAAIAAYKNIMGWPGRGNPYFEQIWGFKLPQNRSLAPFYDADWDGVYNPMQGDYPVVAIRNIPGFVADEMLWCVYNDVGAGQPHGSGGAPLRMEVQQMAWAFDCPDLPVLNNTVFTQHRLTYMGSERLDSCYIGFWSDLDLGCPGDDNIGCNPALNTFFAYNTDAVDGLVGASCDGAPTFGSSLPIQSVTFLNASLDNFLPWVFTRQFTGLNINGPVPAYNMMTGRWPNGVPLTKGGSGYDISSANLTNHGFPGDPGDPAAWSMCTANVLRDDCRAVATHKIGQIEPGQIDELITAWTHHPNVPSPCKLGNVLNDVGFLHNFYDRGFKPQVSTACGPLSAHAPEAGALALYPNPVSDWLVLEYEALRPVAIHCFDAAGRLVAQVSNPEPGRTQINTGGWPVGCYAVQVTTNTGRIAKTVVVQR